jgi:hypothetical protein
VTEGSAGPSLRASVLSTDEARVALTPLYTSLFSPVYKDVSSKETDDREAGTPLRKRPLRR